MKWCSNIEDRLHAAKQHALSQTSSIDELFRTIDDISAEARRVRLELDKLVTKRKVDIRTELIAAHKAELSGFIDAKNKMLGKPYMPAIVDNFASEIKGKKMISSVEAALNTELARCKIEASAIADKIHANLETLRPLMEEYPTMFPDVAQVVLKSGDDVINLAAARVAAHKAAEEVRAIAKRQAEEAAAAKAAEVQPVIAPAHAAAPVASLPPAAAPHIAAAPRAKDPDEVLNTIVGMVRAMSAAEQIEVLNFAIAVTTRRSKAA